MDIQTAAQAMSAVAQVTRLRALRLLQRVGDEGMSVGQLAETLGTPHNTMSTHMKLLENAGFVEAKKLGRSVVYRAVPGRLEKLLAVING